MISKMWRRRWTGTKDLMAEVTYFISERSVTNLHHESYESLETSYRSSCYICYRLLTNLYNSKVAFTLDYIPEVSTSASWNYPYRLASHHLVFRVTMRLRATESTPEQVETYNLAEFRFLNPIGQGQTGRAVGNDTDVWTCNEIIQDWIRTCIQQHPTCGRRRDLKWYPTRLLDLSNAVALDSIRLINTHKEPPCGPYVTLSHCWGGALVTKLTTSNLAQFSKTIVVSSLPKTFVDAVKVSLYLGVQYLWIDALTIIQDSKEDWVREASLMGEVYQNTFCNIGATAANNSLRGLFFWRDPNFINPHQLKIEDEQFLLVWTDVWQMCVERGALNQRGWVTQERWLCPRMLHFADGQLYWECLTSAGCEATPLSPAEEMRNDREPDGFKYDLGLVNWKCNDDQPVSKEAAIQLWDLWDNIIRYYSLTSLTFESDKFIALSGMARVLQRELRDSYIAGLWKTDFVMQLAWYTYWVPGGLEVWISKRPCQYVAPSWSWASINGTVLPGLRRDNQPIEEHHIELLATLVDYHLEYVTEDSFGAINTGFITLRGSLCEVSVTITTVFHPVKNETPSTSDLSSTQQFPYRHCEMRFTDMSHEDAHLVKLDIDDDRDGSPEMLMCLNLYVVVPHDGEDPVKHVHALLLRREVGEGLCFSRVGLVDLSDYYGVPRLLDVQRVDSLADELFDPEYGYTVKII
jgi:hypothetical protein